MIKQVQIIFFLILESQFYKYNNIDFVNLQIVDFNLLLILSKKLISKAIEGKSKNGIMYLRVNYTKATI